MSMENEINPFTTQDILNSPFSSSESTSTWQGFQFEKYLWTDTFKLADAKEETRLRLKEGVFCLDLEDVNLPELETPPSQSSQSEAEDTGSTTGAKNSEYDSSDEFWRLPEIVHSQKQNKLISWDHFLKEDHIEPCSTYFAETGPATFDALLHESIKSKENNAAKIVETSALIEAIFELGLSRNSSFFQWDTNMKRFTRTIQDFSVSGFSPHVVQNMIDGVLEMGSQAKSLLEWKLSWRAETDVLCSLSVAFHAATRSCIHALHEHFGSVRPRLGSLLHIQDMFRQPQVFIAVLSRMSRAIEKGSKDFSMFSDLFQIANEFSTMNPNFKAVLERLVSDSFQPFLHALGNNIGLLGNSSIFSSLENNGDDDVLTLLWSKLLPAESSKLAAEARQMLNLLRRHAPQSQSLGSIPVGIQARDLTMRYTWEAVAEFQECANSYERSARGDVLSPRITNTVRFGDAHPSAAVIEASGIEGVQDGASIFNFDFANRPNIPLTFSHQDGLRRLVLSSIENYCFVDDASLRLDYDEALNFSVKPLLSAQHRLLSFSTLQILFGEQRLLSHLDVQHRFFLLSDGIFASRLSTALFDSDQGTGNPRQPTGLNTGLELQTRETWPPASSELRLALMGILSESLSSYKDSILESSLSFAIRDLSDEDMELCRNADSIHALDFLRLSYRPSSPILESVLTAESLNKYDRILKHLLCVLRLKNVTETLTRTVSCRRQVQATCLKDIKLIFEMQHFFATLADYTQTIAIGIPYSRLKTTLSKVQARLDAKDYEGTLRLAGSVDTLRRLHDTTLDEILQSLMLKKKQSEARRAFEDLMGIALQFSSLLFRKSGHSLNKNKLDSRVDKVVDDSVPVQRFSDDFHTGVRRVLRHLRAMAQMNEASSFSSSSQTASDRTKIMSIHDNDSNIDFNTFEHLLLRLDMFGYYQDGTQNVAQKR